jgi:hypothetical protein
MIKVTPVQSEFTPVDIKDLRNLSQKKGNESDGRSRKPHPVRAR